MHFRVLGCFLLCMVTLGAEPVMPWQPVDLEFEAREAHDWWEFPVRATFTHASDRKAGFQVEAFWNGKKDWVIRTAFPKAGTWTWQTESSDPGLNHKQGTIEVRSPQPADVESNANLRGSLRIAAGNRHFEYADCTPLFLLASTLWAGNTARCGLGDHEDGPFYQHLADRKAKGFNTILMQYFHGYGDYPESLGHRNEGGKPYTNIETKELNPTFFHYLDTRMQALWNQGYVAAIPATWWGKTDHCVFSPQDAQRMSAYCAVRYGAFNAIWSLSGEYQYAFKDCGWTPEDFTELGKVVQKHNPFKRPLSIHPSGQTKWDPPHHVQSSLPFHGQAWLDHHWLQTGQSRDRLFYMVTRPAENRALKPPVPVFLSEAFYERPGDPEGAYTSRWQVWAALLNGTSGFGYGAFGLWQFYDPNDPAGETGKFSGREVPWWEAQLFQGSGEVRHIHSLLSQVDWWNIQPASDRIQIDDQANTRPTAEDISPPQAAIIDDHTWILYLPQGNADNTIAVPVKGKNWIIHWIDPRTGAQFNGMAAKVENGKITLPGRPLPNNEDWVCLIKQVPR